MAENLQDKYPMLRTKIENHSDYVDPNDYGRLLKPYTFNGKNDLKIFQELITSRGEISSVLELGCGTGRATDSLLETVKPDTLRLLDLSPKMLDIVRAKYEDFKGADFIQSDTLAHLRESQDQYDLIFSLWSFSHSVHQTMVHGDFEAARSAAKYSIRRMIIEMMKPGAGFFMIHVDSKSEEQTILFQQWAKQYPLFNGTNQQTPSKKLFDEVFQELSDEGIIDFTVTHNIGEAISYKNLEELLDIFLNFHLESQFNSDEYARETIEEIEEYVEQFKNTDGSYSIKPGSFIYRVNKL
jgi:ubiquinone/menaquinone biosynthesis C-methylase UbiE